MIEKDDKTPARTYRASEELITTVVRRPYNDQLAQALLADRVSSVLGTTPDMQNLRAQCPDAVRELWPLESQSNQLDNPDSHHDIDVLQDIPYPSDLFRDEPFRSPRM